MKSLITKSVLMLMTCGMSMVGVSQQSPPSIQTKNQTQAYKGHQLYKMTKLTQKAQQKGKPIAQPDKAIERIKFNQEILQDPATGKIPQNIRDLELEYATKLPDAEAVKISKSAVNDFSFWKQRGPFNVGGRTRAMAIDRTNENVILAGGVSSGMWRSSDQGLSWRKTTRRNQQSNVTCVVQDPRSGKERVWYYGTGESIGNSASEFGASYDGSGIYKSTNGGRSWIQLEATNDGDLTTTSDFDIVNSLAVQQSTGHLYAATETGIFRSIDEGATFEKVYESTSIGRNEIMITPSGRIYITVIDSFANRIASFLTSLDGDIWENITPSIIAENFFPPNRTVMDFNPLNENEVYFFAASGFLASLLKYNALADTEDIDGKFTDLSENLPDQIGGFVGSLNLQRSYNMVVKIHPENPNIVFVGGTNLYRSMDGFTTKAGQESWIAGYSPLNDVSLYPDQHPDQHALAFFPSNPNKALSANDGGIFVTNDITSFLVTDEPVDWTSLNNGYFTTQPYAISFDPQGNNDNITAGFQDNGTWTSTSTDTDAFWEEDFGGDGAFNAIADGGLTRYVSFQNGNIFRFNFNDAGDFLSFAYVKPSGPGSSDFSFINPFILDANNDNIMYLPVGSSIWRNNNLDEIPEGEVLSGFEIPSPTDVNWTEMKETQLDGFGTITALGVSKFPVANILYYGTSNGKIYKLENATANLGIAAENISEEKDLPRGYVVDINVDPSNSDRVIATYSNYNIRSLFLTEDGGETWTNISGNLEENPDGTGMGPSVRGTAFFGSGEEERDQFFQQVYAATSTGLYRAQLDGEKTEWRQVRFPIGNALTVQIKTRKDGFIAAASHGDGVFSAKFPIARELPENTLEVIGSIDNILVLDTDPVTKSIAIDSLFRSSTNNDFEIKILNTNPDYVVGTNIVGDSLLLNFKEDRSFAKASIALIAKNGKEETSVGFTINFDNKPIYEQLDSDLGFGVVSSFSDSRFGTDRLEQSADDFTVPDGDSWILETVRAFGANNNDNLSNVTIVVYTNENNAPGEEIYNSGTITPISEPNESNILLGLPDPLIIEPGTYWISVYPTVRSILDTWDWSVRSNPIDSQAYIIDQLDTSPTYPEEWSPISPILVTGPVDHRFQLFGQINDAETNNKSPENRSVTEIIWPNPSDGTFNFRLDGTKSSLIKIYNMNGAIVHSYLNTTKQNDYQWDASNLPTGIYTVKVSNDYIHNTFKIIKK